MKSCRGARAQDAGPQITDAELVCLAAAQILLDIPSERRFLRLAICRLGHLFPYLPKQPGYNKRMRALAPQIVRLLNAIAFASPSWCENIRLLDSTPGRVRQLARDLQALGVRRARRLRLLRQPQPLLLGVSAVSAVRV